MSLNGTRCCHPPIDIIVDRVWCSARRALIAESSVGDLAETIPSSILLARAWGLYACQSALNAPLLRYLPWETSEVQFPTFWQGLRLGTQL